MIKEVYSNAIFCSNIENCENRECVFRFNGYRKEVDQIHDIDNYVIKLDNLKSNDCGFIMPNLMCDINHDGSITVSDIVGNMRVVETYYGYDKQECMILFSREHCMGE